MDIKACPSAGPILSFLAELYVTSEPASQMGETEIEQIWESSDMVIFWLIKLQKCFSNFQVIQVDNFKTNNLFSSFF